MSDRFAVLPQYLLPKQALTALAGAIAARRGGAFTTGLIRRFVAHYGVDMQEAAAADLASYATFNDFFTRALKPAARPLAAADWLCPVDGAISQFGDIEHDQIIQAKGHRYSTAALLGGDTALAARFDHGSFATLYLSPKDYHRIHMPCAGRLRRMVHVPGALFSVNPSTARGVPGLFARNERVVCVFDRLADDAAGAAEHTAPSPTRGTAGQRHDSHVGAAAAGQPFALVLVGATIVGSMATVWHGVVNASRSGQLRDWRYEGDAPPIVLRRGEEMGRFLLGSTVVMLFPPPRLNFNASWAPGRAVRLGEAMA